MILLLWACSNTPEPVPIGDGRFALVPDATGWSVRAGDVAAASGVEGLFWSASGIVCRGSEGWYVIEPRPEVRRALTSSQNAERFVHGPLSETGYFAIAGTLGLPARPTFVPVAAAAACLAAGTPAEACAP